MCYALIVTTATAIAADTIERSGTPAVDRGLFRAVIGWLFGTAELSDSQRRFIDDVAASIGDAILASRDLEDLEERLDRALEGPEFRDWLTTVPVWLTKQIHKAAETPSEPPRELVDALGCQWLLERGFQLSYANARACISARDLAGKQEIAITEEPLAFLIEPHYPVPIAQALLASLKGQVCSLALLRVTITKDRPEPWLAKAITEIWVQGLRESLRLLASCPGVEVGEDQVPTEARFDIERLGRTAALADLAFKELVDRAQESGASVYPPYDGSAKPHNDD